MTERPQGATDPHQHVRHPSGSSSSQGSAATGSRLRQHALEHRLSNVIDVESAGRLVECSQMHRQSRFQHLVRRYISQILYGCKCRFCITPTCLSCKKRLAAKPFRAPTQLTARALAHFLASQDNPHQALCPHELNVPPDSLEIKGACEVSFFSSAVPCKSTSSSNHDLPGVPKRNRVLEDENKIIASLNEQHQAKKDMKSLGQNLFDTVTVIYSYSKHIPNPLSVFNSMRALGAPSKQPITASPRREPDVTSVNHRHADMLGVTRRSRVPNGHAVAPNVNGTSMSAFAVQHHSHRNSRPSGNLGTSLITSELMANGQRVHIVRHQLPDSIINSRTLITPNEFAPYDGTQDHCVPRKSTIKQKPHSLDLSAPSKPKHPVSHPLGHDAYKHRKVDTDASTPILPVTSYLNCDIMEQLRDEVHRHRNELPPKSFYAVDYDTTWTFRPSKRFVNRSIFYSLSDPETLLKSFHDADNDDYKDSPLPHLNSTRLAQAFQDWSRQNGSLIFDSLWIALEALFTPPPELDLQKSPRLKASRKVPAINGSAMQSQSPSQTDPSFGRYLSNEEATHIAMVCIHALTSSVSVGWPHTWVQLRKFRSWGIILPDAPPHEDHTDGFIDPWLHIIDELEYEPAMRLADRLVRAIGARMCFDQILRTLGGKESKSYAQDFTLFLIKHLTEVERLAIASKKKMKANLRLDDDPGWTVTATFMEWLRSIIIKKWDGKADINRWGSVGASIEILNQFHGNRGLLNLRKSMFYMPYINERLDSVNDPVEFLKQNYQPNTIHILDCPFLFPPHYLVAYFRTINFSSMFKHYEHTEQVVHLQRELDRFLREPYWWLIRSRLKITFSDYLVLDVRREYALEDTLNQLWGQEQRSMLKPLKVKMGMQEGEVGLDQGGVTYEFFRIVLCEAFKPDNGMFTIDPQTRMTWFQPCSLEPTWKFEMLGIVFSLAVYNGITLPVTFPLALYRHLLAPRSNKTIHDIWDGWPTLANSLDELLNWSDGDVSDVFMRSYSFSLDVFGERMDVDMQGFKAHGAQKPLEGTTGAEESLKCTPWGMWPAATEETPLVTNANRDRFVRDYIVWLTYRSIAPQLEAFQKGFNVCIHPKSLRLFDEITLKYLVEGTQEINVAHLKEATRYEEGYSAAHSTIRDFWSIVEKYDADDRRRLLEFVTASERVPVTGFESVNFIIMRAGEDTEMLPTSSTCFGKLMLPQYSSKEKLKRKLDMAIQNSKGFGIV
ncbi:hypothetical protein CC78DRAFT_463070 [Lojkania enalia]|uniref:HECT-type E3 ubiquitin transferase n=1 Tax=Lojkania enalia TaxID=147567 RepID=A0A9P4KBE9_9PLEO|nr:hypothetical protein CC78DRAFT_463070 [Didymosphaeria enalia]